MKGSAHMDDIPQLPRVSVLADCPYCGGEGADPAAVLGRCANCYGTGRTARFLAERTLARWTKNTLLRESRWRAHGGIQDEVPTRPEGL